MQTADAEEKLLSNQVDGFAPSSATWITRSRKMSVIGMRLPEQTIAKVTDSLPYLQKRSHCAEISLDKGYGSKLDYLTIEQDLIEHQQELQVQKGRLAEAEEAVAAHQAATAAGGRRI